jgi:hypothetical protein
MVGVPLAGTLECVGALLLAGVLLIQAHVDFLDIGYYDRSITKTLIHYKQVTKHDYRDDSVR